MSGLVDVLAAKPGTRTWNNDERCGECCNGDRCDDPTHLSRESCPHCLGTGYALWTGKGMHACLMNRSARRDAAVAELVEVAGKMNRLAKGPPGGVGIAEKRAVITQMDIAIAKVGGAA